MCIRISESYQKDCLQQQNKKFLSDQEKLFELEYNLAVTLKKLPLLEYITAAEDLCVSLEEYGDGESVDTRKL